MALIRKEPKNRITLDDIGIALCEVMLVAMAVFSIVVVVTLPLYAF